eukprot:CAMPEP_0197194904 /NCGR_PEP_ID=MMETSP1423-20130617/30112_1 /TAXON_ID=476441 /ORGANISM="Pseudo-nitzschia heimii, Strain UNC1101" /LENGTH=467 /DNA_ID=CAMNT_0042648413 /DNA_START=119 /DNA_END=1522 /DNA_ORIENTATION=+
MEPGRSSSTKASAVAMSTTTTRTILRIKRRRTETPIPCLRLEGLVNNSGADYKNDQHDVATPDLYREEDGGFRQNTAKRQRSSAVLWKRFDPNDNKNAAKDVGSNGSHHEDLPTEGRNGGEKYRIVDAMFLASEGGSERGDEDNNLQSKKRRKLTLLDSSTIADVPTSDPKPISSPVKKKRGSALKVLDPLTRIIDDSLQEVLIGEKTVESHYRQLTTDPRFIMRNPADQTNWMTWTLDGGTNILHCCALWNDPSTTNELLQRFRRMGSSQLRTLMEATDGDGRTPYEVAQLIGHSRVCEVLEVYGGDTSNYVYDTFYLDHDGLVKTRPNDGEPKTTYEGDGDGFEFEEGPGITTAELTSGVGYWTPEGELILETVEHKRRARSLSQTTEGDIDSNCEEHGGNDYPDEDEYEYLDGYGDAGIGTDIDPYAIPAYNNPYHNKEFNDLREDYDDRYDEYDWEQDLMQRR